MTAAWHRQHRHTEAETDRQRQSSETLGDGWFTCHGRVSIDWSECSCDLRREMGFLEGYRLGKQNQDRVNRGVPEVKLSYAK